MENKRNYIKDLFKNWHLILALLLTSIAMTFIVGSYIFGFWKVVFANKHILSLTILIFAIFAIVLGIYLCINLKNKNLTIADSLYLAFWLIGVVFLIFTCFAIKSFNAERLIFTIAFIIIGCLLTVFRVYLYNKGASRKNFVAKNKISKYYYGIFSKFSFITVLITSGVCVLFSYFLTEAEVIDTIRHVKTFIICSICILPTFVYAITKIKSPCVTIFDVLGTSCILAFPLILVKLLILSYSPLKISIWAVAFIIFIVYLFFRFKFFNPEASIDVKEKEGYFSNLFEKYDIGLILSIGGLIAMISTLLIDCDILHPIYVGDSVVLSAQLLPNVVLTLLSLITLAFFATTVLIGCRKKGVGLIDLFLIFCLSFIAFSFIALISHPSLIMLWLLIAFLIYSIIMLIIRIKNYK